jgi:hypothetical protein
VSGRDSRLTILCDDLRPSRATAGALALCRWVDAVDGPARPDVVALRGGPWRGAFAAVAAVHVVNDDDPAPEGSPAAVDLDGVVPDEARSRRRLAEALPALVRDVGLRRVADGLKGSYLRRRLRSAAGPIWLVDPRAARLLHYVPPERRVVAHLWSRDPSPGADLASEDRRLLLERPDAWVVGDEDGVTTLQAAGVEAPTTSVPDLLLFDEDRPGFNELRAQLAGDPGISADAPLVVALGDVDWWDTPDAFVQVAWYLHRTPGHEHVQFLWVAGGGSERDTWPLRHDIRHAGLEGTVHVLHGSSRPSHVLTAADVVLDSRRGAAPRSTGEVSPAALLPTAVGWADTGGSYPDEAALAAAVARAVDRAAATGEPAGPSLRDRHRARAVAPALLAALSGRDRPRASDH